MSNDAVNGHRSAPACDLVEACPVGDLRSQLDTERAAREAAERRAEQAEQERDAARAQRDAAEQAREYLSRGYDEIHGMLAKERAGAEAIEHRAGDLASQLEQANQRISEPELNKSSFANDVHYATCAMMGIPLERFPESDRTPFVQTAAATFNAMKFNKDEVTRLQVDNERLREAIQHNIIGETGDICGVAWLHLAAKSVQDDPNSSPALLSLAEKLHLYANTLTAAIATSPPADTQKRQPTPKQVERLFKAADMARIELLYLVEQTDSRPGGSVDMAYQELRSALKDISPKAIPRLDENRCAVCAWPLKKDPKDGCVRGNCSQRPRPSRLYDPERAQLEHEKMLRGEAQEGVDYDD
jgi:hypothetical protein